MVTYNDFQLIQLELTDNQAQIKAKWKEWHSHENIGYPIEQERKYPIFLNDRVKELFDKLNDFVPTDGNVSVIKVKLWELDGEMVSISLTYENALKISSGAVNKKQRTTKTTTKKLPIIDTWEHNVDELMAILEDIKVNSYQSLVKGKNFMENRKTIDITA